MLNRLGQSFEGERPGIRRRSQVFSLQMIDPSGSICSKATVGHPDAAASMLIHTSDCPHPIGHTLMLLQAGRVTRTRSQQHANWKFPHSSASFKHKNPSAHTTTTVSPHTWRLQQFCYDLTKHLRDNRRWGPAILQQLLKIPVLVRNV
jgi:hypothetical protein